MAACICISLGREECLLYVLHGYTCPAYETTEWHSSAFIVTEFEIIHDCCVVKIISDSSLDYNFRALMHLESSNLIWATSARSSYTTQLLYSLRCIAFYDQFWNAFSFLESSPMQAGEVPHRLPVWRCLWEKKVSTVLENSSGAMIWYLSPMHHSTPGLISLMKGGCLKRNVALCYKYIQFGAFLFSMN